MKKSITIIVALAMILGMSQCKKKIETVSDNGLGEGVFITLNIVPGDRHIVNTNTGAVNYTDGDVIYVGHGGKYCGMLTREEGLFSGIIYPTSTEDYLHFYFVGGSTPSATPEAGVTTSFTVNISDQSSNLPVLSYAKSTEKYTDGLTVYESFLLNKCGLVEFHLAEGTNEAVTVSGLQTVATISFADPNNAIAATGTTGDITLKSQSATSKWAILLPKSTTTSTTATIASDNYDVVIPAVYDNDYHHNSTAVEVDNVYYVFTVDGNGTTVHFSKGNLQYNANSNENSGWRFAEHQWDVCQTEDGLWDTSGWVDLFGWGTWGTIKAPLEGRPYSQYNYAASEPNFGVTLDGHNDWFTLSNEQWQYILDHSQCGFATIAVGGNNITGAILIPDNSSVTIDETRDSWDDNQYTDETLPKGSVFLPAAGGRTYVDNTQTVEFLNYGVYGCYWTSTFSEYYYTQYHQYHAVWAFDMDPDEPILGLEGLYIDSGINVRLVR